MDQSVDTYKLCIKFYLEKFLKFFFLIPILRRRRPRRLRRLQPGMIAYFY